MRSNDPRDEPALRNAISTWWNRTCTRLRQHPELLHEPPPCPIPGSALLKSALTSEGRSSDALDDLPTDQAAIAVVQAISAISIALDDPDFPAQIFW